MLLVAKFTVMEVATSGASPSHMLLAARFPKI
jgi:hypothetical protein